MGDYIGAFEEYERALEIESQNLELVQAATRCLLLANRIDQAKTFLDNSLLKVKDEAGALALLGQFYLDLGQQEKAIPLFARALQKDPKNPSALFGIGVARINSDLNSSRQSLEQLKANWPGSYESQLLELHVMRAGHDPELKDQVILFLREHESSQEAQIIGAHLLVTSEMVDDALDYFLSHDGRAFEYWDSRLLSTLLYAATITKNWNSALELGHVLTTRRFISYRDWYNFASALYAHRQLKEALIAFERCLEFEPPMREALEMQMHVQLQLKKHEEAFGTARRLLERDPSNIEARRALLAEALSQLNLPRSFRLWREIQRSSRRLD